PTPTPFPYTTLFRSHRGRHRRGRGQRRPGSALRGVGAGSLIASPSGRGRRSGPMDRTASRVRGVALNEDVSYALTLTLSQRERGDRKSTRLNSSHVE